MKLGRTAFFLTAAANKSAMKEAVKHKFLLSRQTRLLRRASVGIRRMALQVI